jgi:hypothetical protein
MNGYERDCDTTASSSGDLSDKPVLVKSSICKEFLRQGSCREGDMCSRAHSLEELLKQPEASHTALCSSYHGHMGCTLGRDCSFVHSSGSLQEIIREHRKGNRFSMLSEYPELVLLQANRRTSSLLF